MSDADLADEGRVIMGHAAERAPDADEAQALRDMMAAASAVVEQQQPTILTDHQVRWRELFERALSGVSSAPFIIPIGQSHDVAIERHGVGATRLAASIADAALQVEIARGLL